MSGRSFPAASIRRIRPLCRWNTIPEALAGGDTLMFLLRAARRRGSPRVLRYLFGHSRAYLLLLFRRIRQRRLPAGNLSRRLHHGQRTGPRDGMTGARRIVSFGDNINDVPMFRISAGSCAVANAVPEARRRYTRHRRQHGKRRGPLAGRALERLAMTLPRYRAAAAAVV